MRVNHAHRSMSAMLVLLFVSVLLAGCQFKFVEPELEYWVNDQIILIGSPEFIEKGPDLIQARGGPSLTPVQRSEPLDLGQLIASEYNQMDSQDQEQFQRVLSDAFAPDDLKQSHFQQMIEGDLIAQLFEFSEVDGARTQTVESTIGIVGSIRDDPRVADGEAFLFAQPNYWTTSSTNHLSYCDDVSGTPGSSSVGGGPYGGPLFDGATRSDFTNQPAFATVTSGGNDPFEQGPIGTGVKIAIFDSSPFSTTQEGEGFSEIKLDYVEHRDPLTRPPTSTITVTIPISGHKREHGLFVAGLARTVAPSSTIELIRVLDDQVCGVVASLNGGIQQLLWTRYRDRQTPLVLNFSLVYSLGPDPDSAKNYTTNILSGIAANRPNTIVVAAAGNQGNGHPPLYPAAFHNQFPVLAVAAINEVGDDSCFSNVGSVRAPGGDGVMAMGICLPSPVPDGQLISRTKQEWAYWSGTSFATPLVSGLAARCLSSGLDAATTVTRLNGANPITLDMCSPLTE